MRETGGVYTREPRTLSGAETIPAGYTLKKPGEYQIWKNGQWVDDLDTVLARLGHERLETVNRNCADYIVAGFASDALEDLHIYDSALEDQVNLLSNVLSGLDGFCSCTNYDGDKKLRPHTSEQLQTVSQHFVTFKQAALRHAERLKTAIASAVAEKDVSALEAIAWTSPE